MDQPTAQFLGGSFRTKSDVLTNRIDSAPALVESADAGKVI
jgi:hypothetical protein